MPVSCLFINTVKLAALLHIMLHILHTINNPTKKQLMEFQLL
jgi:hypothetical protein